jgi:sulfite reductase alpha subunit-like flavoprotein
VYQTGLGMPDRDYYLSQDAKLKAVREKYQRYVQDLLAAHAADVRRWIVDDGATVLVCGGMAMAQGVHDALAAILGAPALDALAETGRYRRDVY